MKLLLDTHILVWLVAADPRLPPKLAAQLTEYELNISTASIWELSIKYHQGKLPSVGPLLEDLPRMAEQLGASVLNIAPQHAIRAGALAWTHRAPLTGCWWLKP